MSEKDDTVERALAFVAEFHGDLRCSLNCLHAEALAAEVQRLRAAPVRPPAPKSCAHGHTTRKVGCVSCVIVFDLDERDDRAASHAPEGQPKDDGGVAETRRRHSAACRVQEAQRQREAEILQAGYEAGRAAAPEGHAPQGELLEIAKRVAADVADNADAARLLEEVSRLQAALAEGHAPQDEIALVEKWRNDGQSAMNRARTHEHESSSVAATTAARVLFQCADELAAVLPTGRPPEQHDLPPDAARILREHAWDLCDGTQIPPSVGRGAVPLWQPIGGHCIDIDGNTWHKTGDRCQHCGFGVAPPVEPTP